MQYSQFNINTDKKITLSKSISQLPTSSKLLFNKKNNKLGFSLIELMVTISIAGVALSIALPSLSGFLAQMRVDNEVTELQRLLIVTRNVAINSGANAILCPLQADNTCRGDTNWTGRVGVISTIDVVNGNDGLIQQKEEIKNGDKLQYTTDTSITYSPSGQLVNTNIGNFNYCPKDYSDHSRGISLSLSGRTYLSSEKNHNGKDQYREGTASVKCK